MRIPRYYEDLDHLHVNTMPNRAYYIPAADADAALDPRRESDRFQLLNGEWSFAYYPSVYDLTVPFWEPDAPREGFCPLPVPSVWQFHGCDQHQYVNIHYPIPYDPPYVPQANPCGAYVRSFEAPELPAGFRRSLYFEGVDSCFYVWINGIFIGYSQVSHSPSEFDVTDAVRPGINEIAVLVLKWCDGSYLEDQDKFRTSGIFRDVYLLNRPAGHIHDFTVTTPLYDNYTRAEVKISLDFLNGAVPVCATLFAPDGSPAAAARSEAGESLTLPVSSPVLWNAEYPRLYTLLLETEGEVIATRVGIREVAAPGGVFTLNGVPVKFHGVNRHDSDPFVGPAVDREHILRDLRLMKEHNVNAIRTSHYPNAPYFPELCDEYGFYVVAEADVEAHGITKLYGNQADFSRLANDERYRESFLDRVKLLYSRDKNHPSIVFWSMGNESGYGSAIEACLAYIKQVDPSRLTHYESDYIAENYIPDYSNLDTKSRMYPTPQEILDYCDSWEKTPAGQRKPMILCEFCHAMGNGPGDLEDYARLFWEKPGLCGGFVWQWCDHAVYLGAAPGGKPKFGYGGDFGEFPHDGNFCMNGLAYPDRRVRSGLLEYKNVLRPGRITRTEDGSFLLENRLDFTNLKDLLFIHYEVTRDGEPCEQGVIDSPAALDLPPHQQKPLEVELAIPDSGHVFVTFTLIQKQDAAFTKAGHILGFEQIELRPFAPAPAALTPGDLSVEETDTRITVSGGRFRYVFDKLTGIFSSMTADNRPLLAKPMEYNIWRAAIDNDRGVCQQWQAAGYDRTIARAYETTVFQENGTVLIHTVLSLSAIYLQRILDIEATWRIDGQGRLLCRLDVRKNPCMPYLPRFGVRLFLPEEMERVAYLGRGPLESYRDKRWASTVGRYTSSVRAQHEDYPFPQENGSHIECDWLTVYGAGAGLRADRVETALTFNVSPYTQEMLGQAKHAYELEESGYTVLCLDYAQSGVGSNSCGPELREEWQLNDAAFTFRFLLSPLTE